ncbi:flavin reductase [Bradyrhizobium sp. BR13661]|jgi:flavin reductase|uniref:flavin reductase n=1 Tax=Bradyrhizobium sp. BR13661 TaxID=2940622 RepID=UPI002473925B|nr:flavin reductase [Bradyrhizobium sp. BR13661]MDH6261783.1 flavin reductase [Bradyrhizobium sp. BR13661]
MSAQAGGFREAMANLGAAVNVVTSAGDAGRVGFTATAVCSVSDTPPMLLVCMNRRSEQNNVVKQNGTLCVNTLSSDQKDLSAVFAGMTEARSDDRFSKAAWNTLKTGAPVLERALASFDCEIKNVIEAGTHSIFLCEVLEVAVESQAKGLVYFQRNYHTLFGTPAASGRG